MVQGVIVTVLLKAHATRHQNHGCCVCGVLLMQVYVVYFKTNK